MCLKYEVVDSSSPARKNPPWKKYFSAPMEELKLHCAVLWGVGVSHLKQKIACLPLGSGLPLTLYLGWIQRMLLFTALKL